jgi:hypothetical protein
MKELQEEQALLGDLVQATRSRDTDTLSKTIAQVRSAWRWAIDEPFSCR